MNALCLPWRVCHQSGGCHVLNVEGGQVACFELEEEARAVVAQMNQAWMQEQPWFRAAIREVVREEFSVTD